MTRRRGHEKERLAHIWLERQGIRILTENFTCRGGELDLVGLEGETLVCFEVRHRARTSHGSAAESLTAAKLARLQRCFQYFVKRHPCYTNAPLRIDAILFEGEDETPQWIRNITGW